MALTLPEKKDEIIDDNGTDDDEIAVAEAEAAVAKSESPAEERLRKLEIELAETRGRLSASAQPAQTPVDDEDTKFQQNKNIVLSDSASLDDDVFFNKYRMNKSDAKYSLTEFERNRDNTKRDEKLAKMEAENQVLRRHGASFDKYQKEINEALADAAPDVRKNPERLAKFMERTLLALSRDDNNEETTTITKKKTEGTVQRRIVDDFAKPNVTGDGQGRKSKVDDELPADEAPILKAFGIRTKSERDKYMDVNLEMDFGGGKVLKNMKNGIEEKQKVA